MKWKDTKAGGRAASSVPTEVLLLLQMPLSEACSLLITQFTGRRAALRVLHPQPSVACHFVSSQTRLCLCRLLIFEHLFVMQQQNQQQQLQQQHSLHACTRAAAADRLAGESRAFQRRDLKGVTVTVRRWPVGAVCLTSAQEQPGPARLHGVCCA